MNVAVPIGLAVVLALALRGRGGGGGPAAELAAAQALFAERRRVYDALKSNRGPDDPATKRLRAELTELAKKIKDLKLLV